MKNKFSGSWKGSKKTSKQRKYRFNAPLHIRQKLVSSHLSKDLKKKYGRKSLAVRKGDKVRIMNGSFRKHEGKVDRVDLSGYHVFVSGIEATKRDGTKKMLALNPSNLLLTELNMDDKLRLKSLEKQK